ncbi:MAG: hypothetical protein AB1600_10525 [Bacteroidota bacterium]
MKTSTKFFILTTVVNVTLSVTTIFSTLLREVRVIDLLTFYATAFGAGASVAALVVTVIYRKKEMTNV